MAYRLVNAILKIKIPASSTVTGYANDYSLRPKFVEEERIYRLTLEDTTNRNLAMAGVAIDSMVLTGFMVSPRTPDANFKIGTSGVLELEIGAERKVEGKFQITLMPRSVLGVDRAFGTYLEGIFNPMKK
jgi:hypothetical protein